ncbi:hypothetical protein BH23CYA1_BH23CYA1_00920 [soil metagenome]
MMAITHAAIACAGVSLLLSTADPLPLSLAVLGSQIPDIDTTTSLIGQVFYPVSSWIEDRFPHRSVTHSFLATAVIAAVALSLGFVMGEIRVAAAVPVGHLLSCFSDCFTRQGVQLFWPDPAWAISVSNPKRRLRTGGPGEYWVLSAAVALLLLGIWLSGSGGVTGTVNQSLGLRDGAIATYNQNAATAEVWAEIKGVWADDRTNADGRYQILGAEGSEFIVSDSSGVYRTGAQILVSKLTTAPGEAMGRQTQTMALNDEELSPRLQQLLTENSGSKVYLSGSITIDFPEEVRAVSSPRQMQTLSVAGSDASLAYHPLELALAQLSDQWATGTITALIFK